MRAFPWLFSVVFWALAGLLPGCSGDGSDNPDGGGVNQPGATILPSDRILRRLTRFEYDNTISDLLHISSTYGQGLPPDDVLNVFDNNAGALRIGALLADKLQTAAEAIAEDAGKDLTQVLPCPPAQSGCAAQFIATFGKRAMRRPLTDAEAARYANLHATVAATDGFAEGIKAVIVTLLQSPHFLYRAELGTPAGGVYQLTPYEIATELSYFLLGSMPDDELFAKADSGALSAADEIATQAKRLLMSPKSRPLLDHFVQQWLFLDRLAEAPKDSVLFADFTPAIRAGMRQETSELFDHVIRSGSGKLPELFTAGYSYMPDALAQFYGLAISGETPNAAGLRKTLLPASSRGGILTHGSILATQAKNNSASPILRGKLVRERLLCQPLPPPPPGLNVQLPPVDPNQTNRVRFSAHDQNPACASCHHLMDPIGFGFERFDAVGHYRTTEAGQDIDAHGEIQSSPNTSGTFDGVVDLQAKLAQSPDVRDCFALQWFRFAYGIEGDDTTAAMVQKVTEAFQGNDSAVQALVLSLVGAERFTLRAADPDLPAGTPPPEPKMDPPDLMSPPPPPPVGMYDAQLTVSSDWAQGYCADVLVKNTGTLPGDWSVTLAIKGTINNLWNAKSAPAGDKINFTGVDYNHHLSPGASASFGFCANK